MLRRLVVVAAVVSSAVAVPSHAASGTLVVRASRSGYVDVVFGASFDPDLRAAQMPYRKGVVGGFWAERVGAPAGSPVEDFGYIAVGKGERAATAPLTNVDDQHEAYSAGRYRIHVIADAPFEVVLPVTGLSKRIAVQPRTRVSLPRVYSTSGVAGADGMVWNAREHVNVRPGRQALVALSVTHWTVAGGHQDFVCFVASGANCPNGMRPSGGDVAVPASGHGSVAAFALPGTLRPGASDVVQRVVTYPGPTFDWAQGYAILFASP